MVCLLKWCTKQGKLLENILCLVLEIVKLCGRYQNCRSWLWKIWQIFKFVNWVRPISSMMTSNATYIQPIHCFCILYVYGQNTRNRKWEYWSTSTYIFPFVQWSKTQTDFGALQIAFISQKTHLSRFFPKASGQDWLDLRKSTRTYEIK